MKRSHSTLSASSTSIESSSRPSTTSYILSRSLGHPTRKPNPSQHYIPIPISTLEENQIHDSGTNTTELLRHQVVLGFTGSWPFYLVTVGKAKTRAPEWEIESRLGREGFVMPFDRSTAVDIWRLDVKEKKLRFVEKSNDMGWRACCIPPVAFFTACHNMDNAKDQFRVVQVVLRRHLDMDLGGNLECRIWDVGRKAMSAVCVPAGEEERLVGGVCFAGLEEGRVIVGMESRLFWIEIPDEDESGDGAGSGEADVCAEPNAKFWPPTSPDDIMYRKPFPDPEEPVLKDPAVHILELDIYTSTLLSKIPPFSTTGLPNFTKFSTRVLNPAHVPILPRIIREEVVIAFGALGNWGTVFVFLLLAIHKKTRNITPIRAKHWQIPFSQQAPAPNASKLLDQSLRKLDARIPLGRHMCEKDCKNMKDVKVLAEYKVASGVEDARDSAKVLKSDELGVIVGGWGERM